MPDAPSKNLRVSVLCLAASAALLVATCVVGWTFPFALRTVAYPSSLLQLILAVVATIAAFRHPVATAGRSVVRAFCIAGLFATALEFVVVAFVSSLLDRIFH
jgi:hypothetical protein